MKVIVAGITKTGTKSVAAALAKLGYKVYDWPDHVFSLEKEWTKILNGEWTTEDFRRMYQDVDAVTDSPACFFWEEIHKAFPEAKIILMTRESDEVWFQSFKKQMIAWYGNVWLRALIILSPTYRRVMTNINRKTVHSPSDMPYKLDSRAQLMKMKYRAHTAHVLQNAPSDKLLVYKVGDGWEPLCKFLEKQLPDEPFPHRNKHADIMSELVETHPCFQKLKREALVTVSLMSVAAGLGMFFFSKLLKK